MKTKHKFAKYHDDRGHAEKAARLGHPPDAAVRRRLQQIQKRMNLMRYGKSEVTL